MSTCVICVSFLSLSSTYLVIGLCGYFVVLIHVYLRHIFEKTPYKFAPICFMQFLILFYGLSTALSDKILI